MNILWFKKRATTAESYRAPMTITHLRAYSTASYYMCPRCNTSLDREYMAYCDCCGQCLNWRLTSVLIGMGNQDKENAMVEQSCSP